MGRPKGSKNDKNDSLEAFARRIERRIVDAKLKDCETIERIICRHLTNGKAPAVAAMMAAKYVEWRYGKGVQPISGKEGAPAIRVIVETISGPKDQTAA